MTDPKNGMSVERRVAKVEMLYEELKAHVRLVAEVQSQHGVTLEEIRARLEELRPLPGMVADLIAFTRSVLDNHERRLVALEVDKPRHG